ncbi:hypothetical protein [Mycobacterium sp.]|uniref:hypothetical protein n=1 Tax=Mycobacterium sp. TaxID=1785 RepID=UPI003F96691F
MAEHDLKIVTVDRPDQGLKTYRVLNGISSVKYPVVVHFSRPVDQFERRRIEHAGILVDDNNPARGLIKDTTLEEVRSQLNVFNGKLEKAAEDASRE